MDNLSIVIFKEMTPKKEVLLVSVFTFLLNKVKRIPKFPQVHILKRSLVPRACLPYSTSWILVIYTPKFSSLTWFTRGTSRMEAEVAYRVLLVGIVAFL